MNATTATQTATFELQGFDERFNIWVRLDTDGLDNVTADEARTVWRNRMRRSDRDLRLLRVGTPAAVPLA